METVSMETVSMETVSNETLPSRCGRSCSPDQKATSNPVQARADTRASTRRSELPLGRRLAGGQGWAREPDVRNH